MLRRKKFDPSSCSLIELCFAATGGYRKAAHLVAYIAAWGVVRDKLGRAPSVEEYADWWHQSHRNAYYEQARFREAFPRLDNPERLLQLMEAQGASQTGCIDVSELVAA
jgi:hypothetical protein